MKVEGVGVMKDTEIKLGEIGASHTLGGLGEGRAGGVTHRFLDTGHRLGPVEMSSQ